MTGVVMATSCAYDSFDVIEYHSTEHALEVLRNGFLLNPYFWNNWNSLNVQPEGTERTR